MTDIVTGMVVHYYPGDPAANPPKPAVFDPNGTKQITVEIPSGSDDGVAAVAIVSRYLLKLLKLKDKEDEKDEEDEEDEKARDHMLTLLTDATAGLVRVLEIKRTRVPPI